MGKYAVGVDFGTLSGRAVVADVQNGRELASSQMLYPHAVMDARLPDGTTLPPDFALQHPRDYLDVLAFVVPDALRRSGVSFSDVIGLGIDATSCTVLPVLRDGTPLCFLPEFIGNPHAYAKLWKHHAANDLANRMTAVARERGERWLARYGGRLSSESQLPRLWELLTSAPEVFAAMDQFVEANDWLVWRLTGAHVKNMCSAGYKGLYDKGAGYPSRDYLRALDPALASAVPQKMPAPVAQLGARAGGLLPDWARALGLPGGISVAVGNVDAHVCVPAAGITQPGRMLAILGTSACHMCLSTSGKPVEGICGVVEDGILPGYFGYEAGQSCCGDHFDWFARHGVPEDYTRDARRLGLDIQQYLTQKARLLRPGHSGLLALDWWNGNRSVLTDVDLTGLLLGMTLHTRAEEVYRALIEATAYGARMIVDNFRAQGVPVGELVACGGISRKNDMLMQIYADVLRMPVHVAASEQCAALGSALFGAVAAGAARGGYDSVAEAASAMGGVADTAYQPIAQNVPLYDRLYSEYAALHDYFGRGGNDVMKRLKNIKNMRERDGDA